MCITVRASSISNFTPANRCVDKFTSSSVMSMNNIIKLKKSRYCRTVTSQQYNYDSNGLEIDICDPPRHKYLNLPNLCNIILT